MEKLKIHEALNLDIFFQSLLELSKESDESDDSDDFEIPPQYQKNFAKNQVLCTYELDKSRQWMKDVMLEESSESDTDTDDDEDDINELLKIHKQIRVYRDRARADPSLSKYMYYSSDLTTGDNKWPNHFEAIKKKSFKRKGQVTKQGKTKRSIGSVLSSPDTNSSFSSRGFQHRGKVHSVSDRISHGNLVKKRALSMSRKRSMNMAALRRYIWRLIAKKEIPKAHRQHVQNQTNKLTLLKKVSKEASKKIRAKAHESRLRAKKEIQIARARRMTREAQVFWKRYVRVEKTQRRHAEKQAQTQRKKEDELREAQKQEQKLKFLITQTELYAQFVSGKKPDDLPQDLADDNSTPEASVAEVNVTDDSDLEAGDYSEKRAYQTANSAFLLYQSKMKMYSNAQNLMEQKENDVNSMNPVQPKLLRGQLTGYQLTGVSWLFNLYRHGLNGILADDMGLGKTVQTIAFLAGLAETYDVWGPFLVIAPASTLNNWHQEFSKFLPEFKVLPYWGTTSERKVLRLFWNQKTEGKPSCDDPFHVLITSYQLATTDMRYFQKIAWHYIIFDEAHALKSSSSIRWKTLLDFNCRNRLLLTGTPVQNTMAELWALLHFIMPTLFDNHDEFNEWFSKNIESYADSKSSIDESDLSRLHRILKPFILRRLKSDVEHELTEKVEVRVLCQLSPRQKLLYEALQKNILVKELIRARSSSGQSNNNIMLMNLVMQFRKVCNHPNIFHCREITSPYFHRPTTYILPRSLFNTFLSTTSCKPNNHRLFYTDFNVHTPSNVHRSNFDSLFHSSAFSFLRLLGLTSGEYWKVFSGSFENKFELIRNFKRIKDREIHGGLYTSFDSTFHVGTIFNTTTSSHACTPHFYTLPFFTPTFIDFCNHFTQSESVLSALLLTRHTQTVADPIRYFLTSANPTLPHQSPKKDKRQASEKKTILNPHRLSSSTVDSTIFSLRNKSLFANIYMPKAYCNKRDVYCDDICALNHLKFIVDSLKHNLPYLDFPRCAIIRVPDRELLVRDSGKLQALDTLLRRLKDGGHRVLIYSQMTKMIDILEEYMLMRRHSYVRLDGSCRISSRRDTVAGFQASNDIFVFLLSTRAGGLGINLTAADTVIFYDSDWNPTVDQQAMDRAHRLGQTKQVTVYRLVCKGTVDERILARAQAKSAIQRMVIQDGGFTNDPLNRNEMVSLLLDDDQIAKASQSDAALKTSLENAKISEKRKYKKKINQSGIRGRKRPATGSSLHFRHPTYNKAPKKSDVTPHPLATTQTINVTHNKDSDVAADESDVIVDDDNTSPTPSTEPAESRGHRRRGRPRLRPTAPSTRPRPTSRTLVQTRWQDSTKRGRGGRGRRRGRSFSGRAAALAGARAGALAASAATTL